MATKAQLTKQLAAANAKIATLQATLASEIADDDTKTQQVLDLSTKLDQLQTNLNVALADDAADQATIDALHAEVTDLQAQLDALEHPTPTPVPDPTPDPTPTPAPSGGDVPAGYKIAHEFDLSRNDGWTLENGQAKNNDGTDRAADCVFGAGPDGTALDLLGGRDKVPGGTIYSADALGRHVTIPAGGHGVIVDFEIHRWGGSWVGQWPAIWERGLNGLGELDWFELFGAHEHSGRLAGTTLIGTPYGDSQHNEASDWKLSADKLDGRHVLVGTMDADGVKVWVDGTLVGQVAAAKFDANRGSVQPYAAQFLNNPSYLRLTLQMGGTSSSAGGGDVPANLDKVTYRVHRAAIVVPA